MKVMLSGRRAGKYYPWLVNLIAVLIKKPGTVYHVATLPISYNDTFNRTYRALQSLEVHPHFPYYFTFSSDITGRFKGFTVKANEKAEA